jgi:hypothetical protein
MFLESKHALRFSFHIEISLSGGDVLSYMLQLHAILQ